MHQLFTFETTFNRDRNVDLWFQNHTDELGSIAFYWFKIIRECGSDVREILHDGQPTACVKNTAFAYVDTFKSHVNIGFFRGSDLSDPNELLEGAGKNMRHVKIKKNSTIDSTALLALIRNAYLDIKHRVELDKPKRK